MIFRMHEDFTTGIGPVLANLCKALPATAPKEVGENRTGGDQRAHHRSAYKGIAPGIRRDSG